jgi:hypothetical protein
MHLLRSSLLLLRKVSSLNDNKEEQAPNHSSRLPTKSKDEFTITKIAPRLCKTAAVKADISPITAKTSIVRAKTKAIAIFTIIVRHTELDSENISRILSPEKAVRHLHHPQPLETVKPRRLSRYRLLEVPRHH